MSSDDDVRRALTLALKSSGVTAAGGAQVLRGVVRDVLPQAPLQRNLLLHGIDAGVASAVQAQRGHALPAMELRRLVDLLVNDYGLAEANAQWCVLTWWEVLRPAPVVPAVVTADQAAAPGLMPNYQAWFNAGPTAAKADRPAAPPPGPISRPAGSPVPSTPVSVAASPAAPAWGVASGVDSQGRWADLQVGGVRQRMRWIEAGSFMMGSPPGETGRTRNEGPQRRVTLAQGFWLGATPVTQALWQALMGDNPSLFNGATRPVDQVSWIDTQRFMAALGARGVGGVRLPTEAEWEYACRAGTSTPYWSGFYENDLAPVAWYQANGGRETQPVGQKPASPWGLYDMHGNVCEWCEDWYGPYSEAPSDGSARVRAAECRVLRGGSWTHFRGGLRAAARDWYLPGDRRPFLSFRIAISEGLSLAGSSKVAVQGGAAIQAPGALQPVAAPAVARPPANRPAGWPGVARPSASRPAGWPGSSMAASPSSSSPAAPAWAVASGVDSEGRWADLQVGSVRERMRWIEAGTFVMGSPPSEAGRHNDEGPRRQVTITQGFWLGATPVTQALWQVVLGNTPSCFKGATHPVEQVSWDDTQRFMTSLGGRAIRGVRLPTEAEWEYACRSGTDTPYSSGHSEGDLAQVAWYQSNSSGVTRSVGQKPANSWGLLDMHGNVGEWVADWYGPYSEAPSDGSARSMAANFRVFRGGGWSDSAVYLRAAYRNVASPGSRNAGIGFRLAISEAPSPAPAITSSTRMPSRTATAVPQAPAPSAGRMNGANSQLTSPWHDVRIVVFCCISICIGAIATWNVLSGPEVASPRADGEPARDAQPKAAQTPTIDTEAQTDGGRAHEAQPDADGASAVRAGAEPNATEATKAWGEKAEISAALEWVRIPGGRFKMGSTGGQSDEMPVRMVTISSFELMKTEVTVAQYATCVTAGGCSRPGTVGDCNWNVVGRENHPINCVSWEQASAFARWVGGGSRLPSEAEWEFAARSRGRNEKYQYPWGGKEADCKRAVMKFHGHDGCGEGPTWPVCSRPSGNSAQGVCDLAGNVWEWVGDWYGPYGDAPSDGSPRTWVAEHRVFRGGSWGSNAVHLRARFRAHVTPTYGDDGMGFRLAK